MIQKRSSAPGGGSRRAAAAAAVMKRCSGGCCGPHCHIALCTLSLFQLSLMILQACTTTASWHSCLIISRQVKSYLLLLGLHSCSLNLQHFRLRFLRLTQFCL